MFRPQLRRIAPTRHVARALCCVVGSALALATLAGCGGGDGGGDGSGDGGSGGAASTSAAPATQATGTPFTATLKGPDVADAGQSITVTITNTGRLPNIFQLEFDPLDAAVSTPASVTLSPGQSADVQVQVKVSPLNINLEGASGGLGDYLDTLEVGSTS